MSLWLSRSIRSRAGGLRKFDSLDRQVGHLRLSRDELGELKGQLLDRGSQNAPPDISDENFTASLIQKAIETSTDVDNNFWNAIRGFVSRRPGPQHIPLFAKLFEVAKGDMRAVYWVGRYLYSHKIVRLDPINEVFYLDALMAYGRTGTALSLWRSRLGREDTTNDSYWLEVGALYHLQAHLLIGAEAITEKISQQFQGYIPPRVSMGLALEYLRNGNKACSKHWIDRFLGTPLGEDRGGDIRQKHTNTHALTNEFATQLLARRQWILAVPLINAGLNALEGLRLSLLYRPRSKMADVPEESITPLLERISDFNPHVAAEPLVQSALLGNLARRGELEELEACLDEIRIYSRAGPIPYASHIVRETLKSRPDMARKLVVESPLATPCAQALYLRLTGDPVGLKLSEPVARQVLMRGNPETLPLKSLALSASCWRLIWHLVRTGRASEEPRELIRAMPIDCLEWLGVLEAVLQGFIARNDFVGALAVCYVSEPVDRTVAASFLQFVQHKLQNSTATFSRPGLRDQKKGQDTVAFTGICKGVARLLHCSWRELEDNASQLAEQISKNCHE